MNYELCKQLKDAGFSTTGTVIDFFRAGATGGATTLMCKHYDSKCPNPAECETVEVPTLSELIEACNTSFVSLRKMGGGLWVADGDEISPYGSTPEEGVAKLWLALHT
jgi:hypothetical protein